MNNPSAPSETVAKKPPRLGKVGLIWLYGLFALGACGWLLARFNDYTEITPFHEDVLNACFGAAAIGAVSSAGIVIWQSAEFNIWRRIGGAGAFSRRGARNFPSIDRRSN